MGFEYVEEELSLKYKGNEYKFRQPSAFEQKDIGRKFKEATEDTDAVDIYVQFFVGLGLPEDVVNKLSMKGLLDLFGYAVGAKKN
jgi:hypothetical protein